jgi:hypothetical protein
MSIVMMAHAVHGKLLVYTAAEVELNEAGGWLVVDGSVAKEAIVIVPEDLFGPEAAAAALAPEPPEFEEPEEQLAPPAAIPRRKLRR